MSAELNREQTQIKSEERKTVQMKNDSLGPSRTDITSGILEFEEKRRKLLFCTARLVAFIIMVFVALLAYIILCNYQENGWHIVLILSLAITSMTMFLLKLLSKPEPKQNSEEVSPTSNRELPFMMVLKDLFVELIDYLKAMKK